VLVYNPLVTPRPALDALAAPLRRGVLVVAGGAPAGALSTLHLAVLHADPWRALAALSTLAAAPASPRAVQRYQDDYTAARVGALAPALQALLGPAARTQGALALVDGALADARAALAAARADVGGVYAQLDALRGVLAHAKRAVRADVLGGDTDAVARALARAEAEVRAGMARLSGWRIMYLAGEVEYTVNALVAQAWFTDLEPEVGACAL
jgi:hypothetical protein